MYPLIQIVKICLPRSYTGQYIYSVSTSYMHGKQEFQMSYIKVKKSKRPMLTILLNTKPNVRFQKSKFPFYLADFGC